MFHYSTSFLLVLFSIFVYDFTKLIFIPTFAEVNESFLSLFQDHSSFPGLSSVASYFQFVPLEEEILDFFTPVARHILTLLQAEPCIPVQMISHETGGKSSSISYEWVLPCKAIFCQDSTVQELITPALLEEHLGLRYLHPDIVPALNPTLRSRLGIETLSTKHLIEIGKAEAKKFSAEANVAVIDGDDCRPHVVRIRWLARWLQCMYRCLEQERNSSQDILDLIGSLGVIPLTDGTFVNLKRDSVFLPLSMKKVSEGDSKKKKKESSSTFFPYFIPMVSFLYVMACHRIRISS